MYSLDINFLNDRPEHKPERSRQGRTQASTPGSRQPLYLGLLALVLLPGLAAGGWFLLQYLNGNLEAESQRLAGELNQLNANKSKLANLRSQVDQANKETQALASVFDQIKPWSALMQDVRDRVPPNIQITAIKQVDPPKVTTTPGSCLPPPTPTPGAPAPKPSPTPSPGAVPVSPVSKLVCVQVEGLATDFNDVNDFLLVLQRSDFLKSSETKLISAVLDEKASPLQDLNLKDVPKTTIDPDRLPKLPGKVKFVFMATLNDKPASELASIIDLKGGAGLVARLEALQKKGVIK